MRAHPTYSISHLQYERALFHLTSIYTTSVGAIFHLTYSICAHFCGSYVPSDIQYMPFLWELYSIWHTVYAISVGAMFHLTYSVCHLCGCSIWHMYSVCHLCGSSVPSDIDCMPLMWMFHLTYSVCHLCCSYIPSDIPCMPPMWELCSIWHTVYAISAGAIFHLLERPPPWAICSIWDSVLPEVSPTWERGTGPRVSTLLSVFSGTHIFHFLSPGNIPFLLG
jgi:hypothetical protein